MNNTCYKGPFHVEAYLSFVMPFYNESFSKGPHTTFYFFTLLLEFMRVGGAPGSLGGSKQYGKETFFLELLRGSYLECQKRTLNPLDRPV